MGHGSNYFTTVNMRKLELYFGIVSYLLLGIGMKYVTGGDDEELKTCGSICNNQWNAQLKQDIPEHCDRVERMCTSCRGQCQYNPRRVIDLKCLCYCKKYQPEFKPYPLQSVCSDQSENLAVDTGIDTAGDRNTLTIGLGIGVPVSILLIIIIIFQVHKRLKSNESNGETTASRDPLLDQPTGDNQPEQKKAQPVQDTGDSSEYIYAVGAQNQATCGIVAQEEEQGDITTVKDVDDGQPTPNEKTQDNTTSKDLPVEDKNSDPHGPISEEDSLVSHGSAMGASIGPRERERRIKDQEQDIGGKKKKVPTATLR